MTDAGGQGEETLAGGQEEKSSKQGTLRRASAGAKERPEVTPAVESYIRGTQGGGEPLSESARASMEPRFDQDFSGVRVHKGPRAARAAQEINARGFTTGQDIYFDGGRYQPDTKEGQRLLAHELTHTVQQADSHRVLGAVSVQRIDDGEVGGSTPSESRQAASAASVFQRMPALSEEEQARLQQIIGSTQVYRMIEQKTAMRRRFAREERRGMGIIRHTQHNVELMNRLDREINAELARLGVADERALLRLVEAELPSMVLARAKQVADAQLRQNEELTRTEMERYAEEVCTPDIAGLLAADAELNNRNAAIASTQISIDHAMRYINTVPAGTPTTPKEFGIPPSEESIMYVIRRIDEYRERLENQRREFDEVRTRFGARYPILLAQGYEPGAFSSAPREELAQVTAQPLQEILDNIEDVREALQDDEMKVWNMRNVVAMATAELGIDNNPIFVQAVEARIRQEREDEGFIAKVKAALAITTTLLAGLIGGPLGAGIVGTLWSAHFLSESAGEFMRESAAENVAMDPEVRDISVNEPELLWVVLDVLGLGLDVGAVVRLLRPVARLAIQTRRLADFAEAARRAAPQAADRLISSLRRRLGRETLEEATTGAGARQALGAGKTLDEYVAALRSERRGHGTVGRSWDYENHPRGLPDSQWRPGDPIDMPSSRGGYTPYDKARQRYWRNRAHSELEARGSGEAVRRPGATTDPVAGLSDDELRAMRESGRAPDYAYPNRPGQTWELEHHGVPQRVRDWLTELGFSRGESRRLIQESHPGSLMEVTPLEHAFFDVEAWDFGRLRGDVGGARWDLTSAADVRAARPLYSMSDDRIREILNRAAADNMNFERSAATRRLRDALRHEVSERGLAIAVP